MSPEEPILPVLHGSLKASYIKASTQKVQCFQAHQQYGRCALYEYEKIYRLAGRCLIRSQNLVLLFQSTSDLIGWKTAHWMNDGLKWHDPEP